MFYIIIIIFSQQMLKAAVTSQHEHWTVSLCVRVTIFVYVSERLWLGCVLSASYPIRGSILS